MSRPDFGWRPKRSRKKFGPQRERNLLFTSCEMKVMNEPSPCPDVSEALSASESAFRAELNQKLRAPLNAIIGFAELLAMRPTGSATKDTDVQHILKAARDLLGIITEELGEGGPSAERPETTPAVIPCDVLYIEDDPVNFTLVERILEFR